MNSEYDWSRRKSLLKDCLPRKDGLETFQRIFAGFICKYEWQKDDMIHYAKELLNFDNEIHFHDLYSDIFEKAEHVIDPDYAPENRSLRKIVQMAKIS